MYLQPTRFTLPLLLLLACWTGQGRYTVAQQVGTDLHDQRAAQIMARLQDELTELIKENVSRKIDFMKRHFDLNDEQLAKAKIFSKRVVAEHASLFVEPLFANLKGLIPTTGGSEFFINGNAIEYRDNEDRTSKPKFQLRIGIQLSHDARLVEVEILQGMLGSRRHFANSGNIGLDFESTSNWRKSFSFLSVPQLEEAERFLQDQKQKNLLGGYLILLSSKFDLTSEQQEQMKTWLQAKIEFSSKDPLYGKLLRDFRQRKIFSNTPEFLDAPQKELWKRWKNDKYPSWD